MSSGKRCGVCALGLASLLAAAHASADPIDDVAFEWARAPGAEACAEQAALAERVEARLDRSVFVAPDVADLTVSGQVEHGRTSPRWRATLTLTRHGEHVEDRVITSEAASCRPLEDALVLVLSLLLDAEARRTAPAGEPGLQGPTPPAPEPGPAAATDPDGGTIAPAGGSTPTPPSDGGTGAAARGDETARGGARRRAASAVRVRSVVSARWSAAVTLGPVASLGLLPAIAGGVRLAGRVRSPGPLELELQAIALGARTRRAANGETSFSSQLGAAALCAALLRRPRLATGLCAGVEIGRMHYASSGFDRPPCEGCEPGQNESGDELLAHATGAAWISVQVWRWLEAGGSLGAAVPFFRDAFTVSDTDPPDIYRVSRVMTTLELHGAVRLP